MVIKETYKNIDLVNLKNVYQLHWKIGDPFAWKNYLFKIFESRKIISYLDIIAGDVKKR